MSSWHTPTYRDRIMTVRKELIALYEQSDHVDMPKAELNNLLDAWDEFEYATGTADIPIEQVGS